MNILVANPGSTSLKFKLFEFPEERLVAQGKIERISDPLSPWEVRVGSRLAQGQAPVPDYTAGVKLALRVMTQGKEPILRDLADLGAVGFKAVHAGKLGMGPGATPLTDEVLSEMERMLIAAPAHNAAYLQAIRCFAEAAPDVPRVALFEPAYHATISEEKTTCGLPLSWREEHGLRRFGFHGASHCYIAGRFREICGLSEEEWSRHRLLSCHLGGSSSLTAIRGGVSVDNTFDFSPQSGIVHSTRCETIDPMIVLYAIREMGLSVDEVVDVLCSDSGLLGISGVSGDIRDLRVAAAEGNRRATLALEVFHHQVRRQMAAMTVALQGLDSVVFTGGIGENGAEERQAICEGMEYLGLRIDPDRNAAADGVEARISREDSPVAIWVLPTNEELIVAREVSKVL
ncbi:acetate/propionate family kinase [Candidatus Sumerlaeota bacterium]|nr:acetate/propionate family kinase [Candidatus Sumerlaeota bacterium]